MDALTILQYPDPRLYTVAKPVAAVDDRVRALTAAMLETMYASNGVGLAATQVDVHERIIVMDTSEERNRPVVLINPKTRSGKKAVCPFPASMTRSRVPPRCGCGRWMSKATPSRWTPTD